MFPRTVWPGRAQRRMGAKREGPWWRTMWYVFSGKTGDQAPFCWLGCLSKYQPASSRIPSPCGEPHEAKRSQTPAHSTRTRCAAFGADGAGLHRDVSRAMAGSGGLSLTTREPRRSQTAQANAPSLNVTTAILKTNCSTYHPLLSASARAGAISSPCQS
jgi:hypothetical protein